MKWRSSSAAFIVLCGLLAVANSSPTEGKKESSKAAKEETAKNINPSESAADENDDLLSRAKKSSTVTTFCVEIKPGDESPTVVVCDPTNTNQRLIPNQNLLPTNNAKPDLSSFQYQNLIPNSIPDYPPVDHLPQTFEPLIFIPQQSQIFQPQIIPSYYSQPQVIPSYYSQPQVIVLRDPTCPSYNPTIISNPGFQQLYASKNLGKSAQYETDSGNIFKNGIEPQGESLRSIPGSNVAGMLSNQGYNSPLNHYHPGQGTTQQNQRGSYVTVSQIPSVTSGNLNPEGQYNRPVLVQCNPSVTPLSEQAYASALASGKANDLQAFDSGMKTLGASSSGYPGQQFVHPSGATTHGIQTTHGSTYHQNRYQPNMYGQMKPNTLHYKPISGFSGFGKSAEQTQGGAIKSEQEIAGGHQTVSDSLVKNMGGQQGGVQSQPLFNVQGNHGGVSGVSGDGRVLSKPEHQQKFGSEKTMGENLNQNSENRFYSTPFSQTKNSLMGGDRLQALNNNGQEFQKQMGFSEHQQQQKNIQGTPCAAGSVQNQPQQATGKDMSYTQALMQRMKSALNQGNMAQPFVIPPGEKQIQSKF